MNSTGRGGRRGFRIPLVNPEVSFSKRLLFVVFGVARRSKLYECRTKFWRMGLVAVRTFLGEPDYVWRCMLASILQCRR